MTKDSNLELFKLDSIDQKILFWLMDNKPSSVRTWINCVSHTYRNRILIDPEKFFDEVAPELDSDFSQLAIRNKAKRVLLVDDDRTFNFLHTRMLEITGIADEVNSTLNGEQAMKLLEDSIIEIPDVILLDLSMPVMDRFSFLEAFNKSKIPNKENISIIVITSSSDYRDKAKAQELGIEHFLTKPVDGTELCNAII